MEFSEFCQKFYKNGRESSAIYGIKSQGGCAEFFLKAALSEKAVSMLANYEDAFKEWFKGKRNISAGLWREIRDSFDMEHFAEEVKLNIKDECLTKVAGEFGVVDIDVEIDKEDFSRAVTEFFYDLALCGGKSEKTLADFLRLKKKNLNDT